MDIEQKAEEEVIFRYGKQPDEYLWAKVALVAGPLLLFLGEGAKTLVILSVYAVIVGGVWLFNWRATARWYSKLDETVERMKSENTAGE